MIDTMHKMGRQFLALAQMSFYFYCIRHGIEVTAELVAGVSGVAGIYTMIKGKGNT